MNDSAVKFAMSNVYVSSMLRVINQGDGAVSMPVKNNVSFSHVKSYESLSGGEPVSIPRALAINNMIARMLSHRQGSVYQKLSEVYKEYKSGVIAESEMLQKIQDLGRAEENNEFNISSLDKGEIVRTYS